MDKKNVIIGGLCLIGGFLLMFWQGQQLYPVPEETQSVQEESIIKAEPTISASEETSLVRSVQREELELPTIEEVDEVTHILENAFVRVHFTSRGGAIKEIALKDYPAEIDSPMPFIFNSDTNDPALGIALESNGMPQDFAPAYELIDYTESIIRFRYTTPEGLQVVRAYQITSEESSRDPYVILHETRFINKSEDIFDLHRIYINAGTFPETKSDTLGEYLNFGYYNGKSADFVKIGEFSASKGFLGFGARDAKSYVLQETRPVMWASVKNQFFASVLTPQEPGVGFYVKPVELGQGNYMGEGVSGSLLMDLGTLKSGEEKLLNMEYYVGPKEYARLEALGQDQDQIMQFGFFGFVSKLLLAMMTAVNKMIPNWGLTIIVVTVIIKLLLWPLTAAQVRSSKRMAAIQEPMKALKEKFKNNPQKLQGETMKLFKEHKVNPAAGCLPLLVQLPIFLGLYFMLRTSSELRFEPFLWIPDLSMPDTIMVISGFPVNILPLLMAVSMFFQMKMTPAPTTDNAQKMVFQMMPFIFLFFCYNFPSGLVLYWTVQNVLTIIQQGITRRMKDPVLDAAPVVTKKKSRKK